MTGLTFGIGALVIVAWAALHAGLEDKLINYWMRKYHR
jgi:hypothetical protein